MKQTTVNNMCLFLLAAGIILILFFHSRAGKLAKHPMPELHSVTTVYGIHVPDVPPPVGIVTRMEGMWIKHCDQTIADVCYRKTDGNGHFGGEKEKNTTGSSHCDLYDGDTCYEASDGQNNHIKLTKQQEDAVAKELQ